MPADERPMLEQADQAEQLVDLVQMVHPVVHHGQVAGDGHGDCRYPLNGAARSMLKSRVERHWVREPVPPIEVAHLATGPALYAGAAGSSLRALLNPQRVLNRSGSHRPDPLLPPPDDVEFTENSASTAEVRSPGAIWPLRNFA